MSDETKQRLKVRKNFNDILSFHNRVIKSLVTNKVRTNQLQTQYEKDVRDEIKIPSNQFMDWSKVVKPFLDNVLSGTLMELQIIEAYKKFIEDIVGYESEFVVTESDVILLEEGIDSLTDKVIILERKINEIKETLSKKSLDNRRQAIINYQKLQVREPGRCYYCGVKLNPENGDKETQCLACYDIPESEKPFLSKPKSEFQNWNQDSKNGIEETQDNPDEEKFDEPNVDNPPANQNPEPDENEENEEDNFPDGEDDEEDDDGSTMDLTKQQKIPEVEDGEKIKEMFRENIGDDLMTKFQKDFEAKKKAKQESLSKV